MTSPPLAPAAATVSVLHLEDDPRDARLVASRLEADGIPCVVERVDDEAGFRAALARGGFDVILGDHSLPTFDGLSALAIARVECPHVPFICVSGSLGEELAIEALKNGATDYVLKHRLSRLAPAVSRAVQEAGERLRRREAEAAVRTLEVQLLHSQKLEAIGQLAGGIAHDFNNLLTVINGYCERLLSTTDERQPLRRDLDLIHKAGLRAAALTRQLLAFSRRQVLQPKDLDLNATVVDVARILTRVLGGNISVATTLDSDLGGIRADPGQIEQVIMNLAINGRDAMPDGGTLTIETANHDVTAEAAARIGVSRGSYVALAVKDSGHGMDAATLGRIFEPFFTTKEPGKGTGLGLPMVHGIVAQSGGGLTVRSAPGQGTTITVLLPRVEAVQGAVVKAPSPSPVPGGSETLLLVEDEGLVRELVRDFLVSAGYVVVEASDAEQALELVERGTPTVDLLITDVMLPGASGLTLAERLTARLPGLPTLFISGYPGDRVFTSGRFDPGAPFLAKPFTRQALTCKVRDVLDGRPPRPAAVLVAEPEADIRELLVQMLERAGHSVVGGRDEPHGDARCDVILLDVGAGDADALHALGRVQQEHPGAEVILMAGAFGQGLLRESAVRGVHITLQKPLDEPRVLQAIARASARRR